MMTDETLKAAREAKLILCEDCQKFFPESEISEDALWGEGVWEDGAWGPISSCIPCEEKKQAEFDRDFPETP